MSIQAFSEQAWVYILQTDLLYPSNVHEKKIHDNGSIKASLTEEVKNDLFNVTYKTNTVFSVTVVVRALARQVALFAMVILVTPFGVVYHGFSWARYSIIHNTSRATEHKEACKTDLFWAYMSICCACLSYFGYKNDWPDGIRKYIGLFTCAGVYTVFAQLSWVPFSKLSLGFIASEKTMQSLKNVYLKRHFGLVSESGHLLSCKYPNDSEKLPGHDGTRPGDGTFYELYKKLAVKQIIMLRLLKSQFPETQFPKDTTSKKIIDCFKEEIRNTTNFKAWLQGYQKLEQDSQKLWKYIGLCNHSTNTPSTKD